MALFSELQRKYIGSDERNGLKLDKRTEMCVCLCVCVVFDKGKREHPSPSLYYRDLKMKTFFFGSFIFRPTSAEDKRVTSSTLEVQYFGIHQHLR